MTVARELAKYRGAYVKEKVVYVSPAPVTCCGEHANETARYSKACLCLRDVLKCGTDLYRIDIYRKLKTQH
jgi:hypothetical protein